MIIKTGRKKRQVANKLINQNCSKTETFNLCKTDLMIRKNGGENSAFHLCLFSNIWFFHTNVFIAFLEREISWKIIEKEEGGKPVPEVTIA